MSTRIKQQSPKTPFSVSFKTERTQTVAAVIKGALY